MLTKEFKDEDVTIPGLFLSGLAPATTYHYRFVAQSSGGGPVYGEDPDGAEGPEEASFEAGLERTFTTYSEPTPPNTDCPNQAFRSGFSAALPDCRAYELVSPPDKEGGDVLATGGQDLEQSAASGDGFTYSSYRAFAGPRGGPFTSQYLARRDPSAGWQSESISAPQEGENLLPNEGLQLQDLFKAFSPDLSVAWNLTFTEPLLEAGGIPGAPNIYRRESASGAYRACATGARPYPETNGPELQGSSTGQDRAVFRIQNKLTPDASEEVAMPSEQPVYQVYECSFEAAGPAAVRLISVLPDGSASPLENTAGTQALAPLGVALQEARTCAGRSPPTARESSGARSRAGCRTSPLWVPSTCA